MARKEPVKKEIDGKNYTFTLLGPFAAHGLLIKIGRLIGPAMSGLDIGDGKSIKDADIDVGMMVKGITSALDEEETEKIILTLGRSIIGDGIGVLTKETIDTEFLGELTSLYKVIAAALEVQFGDFFGEGGVFAGAKGLLEKASIPAK